MRLCVERILPRGAPMPNQGLAKIVVRRDERNPVRKILTFRAHRGRRRPENRADYVISGSAGKNLNQQ